MTNELLNNSAKALEQASVELDKLRESIESLDMTTASAIAIQSLIIESIGLLGQAVSSLQARLTAAGIALAYEPHQCPECGLPLGTNASHDDSNGCHTCTLAIQQHARSQGNKCPDCGCLIGTNTDCCARCRDEAYFQRVELARSKHKGCQECGMPHGTNVTCSTCEAHRA